MKWWPKFSITDLLWLTVAVALGFAISPSGEPVPAAAPLNEVLSAGQWPDRFLTTGCLLLIFALVQHGRRTVWQMPAPSTGARFAFQLRAVMCFALAAVLGLLSMVRLLLARGILIEPKHEFDLQVWDDLWPDILLSVVAIASLRVFLVARPDRLAGTWWRRLVNGLMAMGLLTYALWILTYRTEITMLVHVAINGLESVEPSWLQREGAFPHHAMEGFWSFWVSTLAAVGALVGGALLVMDSQLESTRWRRRARLLFWILVGSLAAFVFWFANHEFPRIDPDMANAPSARLWSDSLAGVLLCIGLALCLAVRTAPVRHDLSNMELGVPVGGLLSAAGALCIAVAGCWFELEIILVFHSLRDIFTAGEFLSVLETFADLATLSETFLPFLVLFSAITLLWQFFRHPDATKTIAPIAPREFGYFTVAWAALLAVAVPALWAFAMCYWLGPLVI